MLETCTVATCAVSCPTMKLIIRDWHANQYASLSLFLSYTSLTHTRTHTHTHTHTHTLSLSRTRARTHTHTHTHMHTHALTHSGKNQTVVLVPGDPLRNYRGYLNYMCNLYVICTSVRMNSVKCRLLPSGGVQWAVTIVYEGVYIPNIVAYHVLFRGWSTLQSVVNPPYWCMYD